MGGRGLTLSSSPARGLRFGKAGVENPPENRDPLLFSSGALLCSSSTLQWWYQHGLPAWLVGAIALMPPQPGSAACGRTVFLDQHAMQDHRKLACQRHFRLRHADALGELHGPGLECRGLHRARENDVCGLIERGAHALVADLRDPAGVIDFARLISLRRDPIMCANLFRVLETCGVIDCGRICQ